jgi:hypothetical protein
MRRLGLGLADIDWTQNWRFAVPALLYGINNNLFVSCGLRFSLRAISAC